MAGHIVGWMRPALLAAAVLCLGCPTLADLPVHCVRSQLEGDWDFFLGAAGPERTSCGHQSPDREDGQPEVALAEIAEQKLVTLGQPNVAKTASDLAGRWTMIYDEGFQVDVDNLSLFAFSRFDLAVSDYRRQNVSRCGETQLGWYRSADRTRWGCYYAKKRVGAAELAALIFSAPAPRQKTGAYELPLGLDFHSLFVSGLNSLQGLWTAKAHDKFVGKSLREMNSMAGISRPYSEALASQPQEPAVAPSFLQARMTSKRSFLGAVGSAIAEEPELPGSWDWRNASGVNYLDEVLDQGECGSCYMVATTAMLSARHRIRQRDPALEAFSIEFPLYCSEYNQGCSGGYAFLASRWASDAGLVPKSCGEYASSSGRCSLRCDVDGLQRRWRADNHHYVGGYYGAATEPAMMRELVRGGPLVVSFEPKADVMYYNGGIYASTPNQHAEWERVDHAVLLVGYGEENGHKYWVLQNSWGTDWGEDGFFRMARGTDESGIESIAVAADVVEDTRPPAQLLRSVSLAAA